MCYKLTSGGMHLDDLMMLVRSMVYGFQRECMLLWVDWSKSRKACKKTSTWPWKMSSIKKPKERSTMGGWDHLDGLYTWLNPVKAFIYILRFWRPVWRSAHLAVPKTSLLCGWQGLGARAGCQAWASEMGEQSSGHWSTWGLPVPCNIKQRKLSQRSPFQREDIHLQLHSTTSKLQCWTPYGKQLTRQEHNITH